MNAVMAELNERQRAALVWLHGATAPPPPGSPSWAVPSRTVYAFSLADHLDKLDRVRRQNYQADSRAAANTLVALKRRGLADNDGGGVFLQCKWWITREGQEVSR